MRKVIVAFKCLVGCFALAVFCFIISEHRYHHFMRTHDAGAYVRAITIRGQRVVVRLRPETAAALMKAIEKSRPYEEHSNIGSSGSYYCSIQWWDFICTKILLDVGTQGIYIAHGDPTGVDWCVMFDAEDEKGLRGLIDVLSRPGQFSGEFVL